MPADRVVFTGLGGHWGYAYVYPDRASMHRAGRRYVPGWDPMDCDACFQESAFEGAFLGVARFIVTELDAERMVHEMVHAAIASIHLSTTEEVFERLLVTEDAATVVTVEGQIHGEELLAHQIGAMSDSLIGALAEAGYGLRLVDG